MVECRLGAERGIPKEGKTTLVGDGYVQGPECGDGFTGVYACQNPSNLYLHGQLTVCQYLN